MRRDGHIIEEIVEHGNLEDSFDTVVRGTKRKNTREGKWLLAHREEFLEKVKQEILNGKIELGEWHEKVVVEFGKARHIQIFNMRTRIKVNAVMSVVDKHLRNRFIRTTSASIQGRGMHELKNYIQDDIKNDPEGTKYAYKFDLRKFYQSVNQDFVMYCVNRIFKDKKLIGILDQFVRLLPSGISIGLRSSQGLGNLLLSMFIDHYIKDRYGIKHFYRYCDDGLFLSSSKKKLWIIRDIIHERASLIELNVKPDERVFPITIGIDFLGFVIYPDHVRLRKRIKQKMCRKIKHIKSRKRRQALIGSFYGLAKHADCRHLLSKILTTKEMRKFSELGVSYTPLEGKKKFAVKRVRFGDIVNADIEIHDYEKDVKTDNGLRYLIKFKDVRSGEYGKFFTDSEQMKAELNAIAEMEDGFPFQTVIKQVNVDDGDKRFTLYKFT